MLKVEEKTKTKKGTIYGSFPFSYNSFRAGSVKTSDKLFELCGRGKIHKYFPFNLHLSSLCFSVKFNKRLCKELLFKTKVIQGISWNYEEYHPL
jgi:hypothetical protein